VELHVEKPEVEVPEELKEAREEGLDQDAGGEG
jgi:hypothetical protein